MNKCGISMICLVVAMLNAGVVIADTNSLTPADMQRVQQDAEKGDALAQQVLGGCYYFGDMVKKNFAEAAKWYRKSAEQGQADAQCNLGVCYENGTGVTKDHAEALKWFRKAADQGNANAQRIMQGFASPTNSNAGAMLKPVAQVSPNLSQ